MAVKRIVANIAAEQVGSALAFYRDVLGMQVVMDLGWITTFAAHGGAPPQISVAAEGGSGTQVPDISVEVDNLDEIYERARSAVRRFYVRDPFGRLINILIHD